MSWKTVKLADLCAVITKGTTPSNIGESFTENGVNYIRSEMITDAKYISSNGMLYISDRTHEKLISGTIKFALSRTSQTLIWKIAEDEEGDIDIGQAPLEFLHWPFELV